MSPREWKAGEVALVTDGYHRIGLVRPRRSDADNRLEFAYESGGYDMVAAVGKTARPLVVIDPEDEHSRAAIEITQRIGSALNHAPGSDLSHIRRAVNDALRVLVMPPRLEEPTDPKALVTDRRSNIWRLLADGDWVCTSGPDIGEYLNWDQLAGDRGPVEVQS